MGGCGHDDLMQAVDRCHGGVALDDSFRGRHLGAIIVRDVAFTDAAFIAFSFRPGGEEGADALRLALQALDPAPLPGLIRAIVVCSGTAVLSLMILQHVLHGALHPLRTMRQLGVGATALLRGVAWQFDAVDGEHLTAYQSLSIASQQDLGEQFGDLRA